MIRTHWLVAACTALLLQTPAWAHGDRSHHDRNDDLEVRTRFGTVIGSDDTQGYRHLVMEGRALREAASRRAALEGASRSRRVEEAAARAASLGTPARSTGASTGRAPTTAMTKPSARRSTRRIGSEDCLYLNIGARRTIATTCR